MYTKRIIPCLDIKDGKVVKGVNFIGLKDVGDPIELAQTYARQGADELVFLDITATHENRRTIAELAAQVAAKILMTSNRSYAPALIKSHSIPQRSKNRN